MGLLVKKYYQGADIALNDIGAVSWLADINLLDLRGLGTNDIRDKSLTTEGLSSTYVEKLSEERGVKLTILHKRLRWDPGKCKTILCLVKVPLHFMLLIEEKVEHLRERLNQFSTQLP
jgi:hypothetical protein